MSRAGQQHGEALERMAEIQASANGWAVQRIATPVKMRRGIPVHTAKVLADLFGCTETGRAVLIECKSRQAKKTKGNPTGAGTRRPCPSDFEPHQVHALTEWHKRGALVYVAWIDGWRVRFELAADIINPTPAASATTKKES